MVGAIVYPSDAPAAMFAYSDDIQGSSHGDLLFGYAEVEKKFR
jgi:hypothetical protein